MEYNMMSLVNDQYEGIMYTRKVKRSMLATTLVQI